MLSIEKEAFNHLVKISKHNTLLFDVMKKNGVVKIPDLELGIFDYMVRIIIKQKLSNSAGEAIWNRLIEISNHNILKFINIENREAILKCGISNRKFEAILRLKKEHKTNNLTLLSSCQVNKMRAYIHSLYGFGEWSSAMICLFFFKHQDIWSDNDAALNKATLLLGIDQKFIKQASPYKSFLALHLWKAVNSRIIQDKSSEKSNKNKKN